MWFHGADLHNQALTAEIIDSGLPRMPTHVVARKSTQYILHLYLGYRQLAENPGKYEPSLRGHCCQAES